jgi:hypothetical protein
LRCRAGGARALDELFRDPGVRAAREHPSKPCGCWACRSCFDRLLSA